MKIIHVSNFDLNKDVSLFYHTARKLSLGFARLGHAVVDFSDRDVARQAGFLGWREMGISKANRRLVSLCKNFHPDMLVFGHADIISADTIAEIRALFPEVRVAQWNFDPLSSEDNCRRIEGKLDVVDATFMTTAGDGLGRFSRPQGLTSFLPNPLDQSIEAERSYQKTSHGYDLVFPSRAGRIKREWGGRLVASDDIARELQAALPGRRFSFPGLFNEKPVFGMTYFSRLSDARIGLSLSQASSHYLYASDRMAHMLGLGLLVCVDKAIGFQDVLGKDSGIYYESVGDLLEQITWFLGHDEALVKCARKGCELAHEIFSGSRLAQYMIERTFRKELSIDYGWPTKTY